MTRDEVYNLIDGERDYQNSLGPERKDPQVAKHTVGDYCTMLQYYMTELNKVWTLNAGDQKALDVIRKIGGIAVHCMEDHGAPQRIM